MNIQSILLFWRSSVAINVVLLIAFCDVNFKVLIFASLIISGRFLLKKKCIREGKLIYLTCNVVLVLKHRT